MNLCPCGNQIGMTHWLCIHCQKKVARENAGKVAKKRAGRTVPVEEKFLTNKYLTKLHARQQ